VEEAPTTRFASPRAREERDIGSWLGELRRKTSSKRPAGAERGSDPSAESTNVLPSGEPTNVIAASDDATTAIPTTIPTAGAGNALSAEETRAIPVSRPQTADSDVATEQLNARGQHSGGGVSAADLLRREGRL
jgi:RND superfamily putative drug exporter